MKDKLQVVFMVHVDGIIIHSDGLDGIDWAKAELISLFRLTDLAPPQLTWNFLLSIWEGQ